MGYPASILWQFMISSSLFLPLWFYSTLDITVRRSAGECAGTFWEWMGKWFLDSFIFYCIPSIFASSIFHTVSFIILIYFSIYSSENIKNSFAYISHVINYFPIIASLPFLTYTSLSLPHRKLLFSPLGSACVSQWLESNFRLLEQ